MTCPEPILLVDDDPSLLDGLRRAHRKSFDLRTACGGAEALERIATDGPFAVVVSDYQMPGMNGVELLARVADLAPAAVRVMLTGNADLQSAIRAVNEGRIFRFLQKPCEQSVFAACLDAAVEQHRLVRAEKVLLEQTVRGCIEVLADVLALSNPAAFGRSTRARGYVRQMVAMLRLEHGWKYETAALLSQIGLVSIPADLVDKIAAGEPLSAQHEQVIERHPAIAGELLEKIPRMDQIAQMIAHQRLTHADAARSGLTPSVAIGAQILGTAIDFDELFTLGASRDQILRTMALRKGRYDPRVLRLLESVELPGQCATVRSLAVRELRPGMVLDQDVVGRSGAKIVAKGTKVTPSLLARLRSYAELGGIAGPIRALVPGAPEPERDGRAA